MLGHLFFEHFLQDGLHAFPDPGLHVALDVLIEPLVRGQVCLLNSTHNLPDTVPQWLYGVAEGLLVAVVGSSPVSPEVLPGRGLIGVLRALSRVLSLGALTGEHCASHVWPLPHICRIPGVPSLHWGVGRRYP